MTHDYDTQPINLSSNLPTRPGFYWARWRTPWGVAQEPTCDARWEVVDVFVNDGDSENVSLMVLVAGVEKPQKLEDFSWSESPLPAPK